MSMCVDQIEAQEFNGALRLFHFHGEAVSVVPENIIEEQARVRALIQTAFVDNFSGHKIEAEEISNIRIEKFSANLTANVQP